MYIHMYVSAYTYGIRLHYTFPFKITEIILYTEFGIVIENQKKKNEFQIQVCKNDQRVASKAIPCGAHGFGFKTWNRVLFFYIKS